MRYRLQNLICTLALLAGGNLLKADAIFTNLVRFTYYNPPNVGANYWGAGRLSALVLGNDGNFYGTTDMGGTSGGDYADFYDYFPYLDNRQIYGYGTVFKMTPGGTFTSLYSFGNDVNQSRAFYYDGTTPVGNLVQGTDGNLYGVTANGGSATTTDSFGTRGPAPVGTAFSITTAGTLTTVFSFGNDAQFNTNLAISAWVSVSGGHPTTGLVQGSDGNFYGTTSVQGDYGWGTVFRLTPYAVLTTLHSFRAPDTNTGYNYDGYYPNSELVEGKDGNFYGTTSQGGESGGGTVYRITPDGAYTTLISFDGPNGFNPLGGLVLGKDGNFYGTTIAWGTSGNPVTYSVGTVFKLTTNGVLTVLHYFTGSAEEGWEPHGTLMQGSDGNLYGTTWSGGNTDGANLDGYGTVFQITTNGEFTTLHKFNGADGSHPDGALVQGPNGDIYGTTVNGGISFLGNQIGYASYDGYGTIFRITIPPTFQSVAETNGQINFIWSIMPGQMYQVQYNTDLASTNWLNSGSPVTASNAVASAAYCMTNMQCYYRIRLTQ
jgi:uncharacterized repeat protein (TIGR03803 family)